MQDTQLMAGSPGMRLLGLASGASTGGYAMIRDYLTLAVLAALMSTLSVIRHTRQGEETGRAELLGATVIGRHAPLAAALFVTTAANAALAVLLGSALIAAGQPAAGGWTAGAAVAAAGLAFAGVTAVTVQLSASTRGAAGLSAAVLGFAFLTSGAGNMAGHVDASGTRVVSAWPAWLSPIGWGQQMRPFGGDHWWPLTLAVGVLLAGAVAGAVLRSRRDLGHGMLPQRPGPARAARALLAPAGLAWRLRRGPLLGWSAGMLGFGLVLGGLTGEMEDVTGAGRDWYTRMGGSDRILDAYRASIIAMAGMAAAVYAVQALLRLRAEESDGTLEPVLATAVSRSRWVAAHAVTATVDTVALLVLFAVGMGLTAGGVIGDPAGQVWTLLGAALTQLPGIMVLGAAVVAMTGLLPRLAVAGSWAALLGSIVLGPLFGPTLGLSQAVQDLSPFTHVPRVPAAPFAAAPVLALTVAAVVLAVVGGLALRRRNLALPA